MEGGDLMPWPSCYKLVAWCAVLLVKRERSVCWQILIKWFWRFHMPWHVLDQHVCTACTWHSLQVLSVFYYSKDSYLVMMQSLPYTLNTIAAINWSRVWWFVLWFLLLATRSWWYYKTFSISTSDSLLCSAYLTTIPLFAGIYHKIALTPAILLKRYILSLFGKISTWCTHACL